MGELLKRKGLWAAMLVAAVAAVFAVDALVVTDEERLEAFAKLVIGEVNDARLERALAYVDLGVQPVEVLAFGQAHTYGSSDSDALRERGHDAVVRLRGETLRTMRQSITVESDSATVAQRLISGRGMMEVEYRLRRHGDRWLLERLWLRR